MAEEKKENWFSKVKKKVSALSLDTQIEAQFNIDNESYQIYEGTGILNSKQVFGILDRDKNTFLTLGVVDASYSSILADEDKNEYYYITKVDHSENIKVTVKLTEDEKQTEYTRQGTLFTLNPGTKKVDVVKVKDNYFLKLSED